MVYGIFSGEYSDWTCHGYFETQKDAAAYCKEMNNKQEYDEYEKISKRIETIYSKYDKTGEPHKTSAMNKAMTWSEVEMNTLMDNSNSNIAELLIKGVNMGIIEGRKIINKKKLDKEVEKLVSEYVEMQERNLEILKEYL